MQSSKLPEVSSTSTTYRKMNGHNKENKRAIDPISTNSKRFKADSTQEELTVEKKKNSAAGQNSAKLKITPDIGSIKEGKAIFGVIVRPIQPTTFLNQYWQQQPIKVQQKHPDFYKTLVSYVSIDRMLRRNHVEFVKHLNIQSKDGNETSFTHPIGRAMPPTVWQYFKLGFNIRISNPQKFVHSVYGLTAGLQEYFQCHLESTVHLSSKNSEGYAPRYENAEIFILQIEGKKHWRVYRPSCTESTLPSEGKSVVPMGEPVLDVLLESGESLYIPRGFIHDATNAAKSHSLHLSLNIYKKQTFGDLLGILLPLALKAARKNDDFYKGLPLDIWQHMGLVNSDNNSQERTALMSTIKKYIEIVSYYGRSPSNMDAAVDQMALRYQHDALPPNLKSKEVACSVLGANIIAESNSVPTYVYIELDTKIRLVRENIVRVVHHNADARVYYSSDNSIGGQQ